MRPRKFTCANKNEKANLIVRYQGDVILRNTQTNELIKLRNVYYCPDVPHNLFSALKVKGKLLFMIDGDETYVINKQTRSLVQVAHCDGRFWKMVFEIPAGNVEINERESFILQLEAEKGGSREIKVHKSFFDLPQIWDVKERFKGGSSILEIEDNCEVGDRDFINQNSANLNLGGRFGMKISDLEAINEKRTRNLKICEGLLWHLRLDHASESYLRMAKNLLPDLKGVVISDEIKNCIDCRLGKAKRQPFKEKRMRAKRPFQIIESDTAGQITPASIQVKAKYFVTFTDNYSRYALGYELVDKKELHVQFKKYLSDMRILMNDEAIRVEEVVNNNLGQQVVCKIGRLHTDNGTEYKTDEMRDLFRRENIRYDPCNPHTPQHNGIPERLNLEIEQKVRTLLQSSSMPLGFWGYAMKFALYVHNLFINSAIDFKTPHEMITGKVGTLKNIRRFGCLAIYVIEDEGNSKFAPTGSKDFLVGMTRSGYLIYDPKKGRVIPTKHVTFIESKVYGDFYGATRKENLDELSVSYKDCDCENMETENGLSGERNSEIQEDENLVRNDLDLEIPNEQEITDKQRLINRLKETYEPVSDRTREATKRKLTWDEDDVLDYEVECEEYEVEANLIMYAQVGNEFEPANYGEAINCKDSEFWRKAMVEEFDAHKRMETWRVIRMSEMLPKASIVTSRWVFKIKDEPHIGIRRKGRLVARGFSDLHEYGIDETYAPVARMSDFKCLVAIANKHDLELEHIDVKVAFLNGQLEKKVYMRIPEGLSEYLGNEEPNFEKTHILELDKAIYGLKVSPKRWFKRFSEAMKKLRFIKYEFLNLAFTIKRLK